MCQCESQLLPGFVCKWSQSASLCLTIWLFWHGAHLLSLDMKQRFFLKPFITQHLSLPCMKSSTPKTAECLSFLFSFPRTFWREKKNPIPVLQQRGCYLLVTDNHSSSFGCLLKCQGYLGAALSNFRYFLHTWRMPHSSSEFLWQFQTTSVFLQERNMQNVCTSILILSLS